MQYRADIDGLRAVAVTAVAVYHAFPAALPGGFVGVDVFFVISGYLIATLIADEHAAGRFSLVDFYVRRARRILPALVLVCVVVAALGALLFLPAELRDLGQSLAAAMVFLSNVLFWTESGYFETSAALKPLLHTWSLGVEEQFYLFWPLLFLLLAGQSRAWLVASTVALLGWSVWIGARTSASAPDFAFFMLPPRLWELLCGVLLALTAAPRRPLPRWLAEAAVALGLLAILAAVAGVGTAPLFPVPGALLPCLGAALVILGGGRSRVAASPLRARPVVGLGRISYSLYLWHWPVLVFAGYVLVRDLRPVEAAAALGLSVVLAVLSWRLVEQPARRGKAAPIRVFVAAGAASAVVMAVGVALHLADGWPQRIRPDVLALADETPLVHDRRDCHFASRRDTASGLCRRGAPGAAPSVLLLGDSHADMYSPALFAELDRRGLAGIQLTDSGYLPAPGHLRLDAAERHAVNHRLLDEVLETHPEIGTVIVGQFWRQALGYAFATPGGAVQHGRDAVGGALRSLVAKWPGRRFVLLGPVPDSQVFGANAAARAMRFGAGVPAGPRQVAEARLSEVEALLAELSRLPGVTVLPMLSAVCGPVLCRGADADGLLYSDHDHLSVAGAFRTKPVLDGALPPAPQTDARAEPGAGPPPERADPALPGDLRQ